MRRREFLRYAAIAAAGGTQAVLSPPRAKASVEHEPDVWIRLRSQRQRRSILPGPSTEVWSYRAALKRGDDATVQDVPGSYLGPTLRLQRGQRVRIDFRNRLEQNSIVHWHGLHVPADMDGHPRFAVPRGGGYRYEFEVTNRAGMYWYHPHPHRHTGEQVYRGLAGLLIVTDPEEQALGLPDGEQDVPLVIQDRHFSADNQLTYGVFGTGPHHGFQGFLGNRVLVNGQVHPTLDVARRPYRLRLLNASNSRIYKLAWSDGTPLTVIATDGGLLRRSVQRDYVTLAPAERVELWVDFAAWPSGATLELTSRPFEHGMEGFGPFDDPDLPMGAPADVLTVRVREGGPGGAPLPARLSNFERYRPGDAVNSGAPRQFEFAGQFGTWTINDRTFEMTTVADDERVALGTMESWEFSNPGRGGPGGGPGGMMMRMPHPVHAHGQPFQVVHRRVEPVFGGPWGTLAEGYVDEGWKDTVLLMPGETAQILKRFDDHVGLYLLHCHNLEHEDAGMMRNFLVET